MPSNYTDKNTAGVLYVTATPIGNMDDISIRAREILSSVDYIAAEDTRETGKLLADLGIKSKLISYHEHNEDKRSAELIRKLQDGCSIALVSDAGTPCVSDPGYRIVHDAAVCGLSVVPIPGPSAAVAALSASGLPTDMFAFLGFAPKKDGKRISWLTGVRDFPGTLIFYESAKRLLSMLRDILDVLGNRDAVIAREITKKYETFIRGNVQHLINKFEEEGDPKGEITILVSGKPVSEVVSDDMAIAEITKLLKEGNSLSTAVKTVSGMMSLPRKKIYDLALSIKNEVE